TAAVVANQVTPVVFQVQPIGSQGPTTPPSTTGLPVQTASHGPSTGVLGTSIGMPLTGSEVLLRLGFSILCLGLGVGLLRTTVRRGKS
ncbi:MAG: hypothetical protein ACYDGR_01190, partial [Candidatus Dormibacteria bacterium]